MLVVDLGELASIFRVAVSVHIWHLVWGAPVVAVKQ